MNRKFLAMSVVLLIVASMIPMLRLAHSQTDPILGIEPASYTAEYLGEVFDLNVTIYNAEAADRIVGVEFKLSYCPSLLSAEGVVEGPFLASFAGLPHQGTVMNYVVEADHVLVAIVILPNSTGGWEYFPTGNGTLATLTFKAIDQPLGAGELPYNCTLSLYDTKIVDDSGVPPGVTHTTQDCYYEILPNIITIEVEPPIYAAEYLGEAFSVDVTMNNLHVGYRAVAVEFKLGFNSTLLDAKDVAEGPFMVQFAQVNPPPYNETFFNYNLYPDYVLVGIVIFPHPANGTYLAHASGTGILATISFEAIYQGLGGSPVGDALTLYDTKIADDTYQPVAHLTVDGYYEMLPNTMTLKVEPPTSTATAYNEVFSVNVTLNNVLAGYEVVGAEFKLGFNSTMLSVESVTEGPFLAAYAGTPHLGTWFGYSIGSDYVLFGVVILPNATGSYEFFPSGNGTIATITFKATYQHVGCGLPPETSPLDLYDTKIADASGVYLVPHLIEDGLYEIEPALLGDVNGDSVVDIFDLVLAALAFGSSPGDPNWNPVADLNGDDLVDIFDLVIIAISFGNTCP
jgi:hypothetical protein